MADVKCLQLHMRGQYINVEGRRYLVSNEGIVTGLPEADAKDLLKMSACYGPVVQNPVQKSETKPEPKVELPKPTPAAEPVKVASASAPVAAAPAQTPNPKRTPKK